MNLTTDNLTSPNATEPSATEPSATELRVEQSTDLREVVAMRAYFLSQQAGFETGRELDFWLQAESETLAALPAAKPRRARKPRAKKAD